ncbi:MAG: outer membrane beta-barrel protein [Bacteroidetes bacterium]|nr:outer membrane beta-barrel protein [Bacteroidota bacterium]
MKKILTLAFLAFALNAQAQDSDSISPKAPIGGRPNIPNDLTVEFGWTQLTNRPADLAINFFGSRSFNVYYQKPFLLFGEGSGFVLSPGIGLATNKFSFKDDENLFRNSTLGAESSILKEVKSVYGNTIEIKFNNLAVNYVEVPIDLQYHINKKDYSKSFRVSLGARVGYLYQANTKISFDSPTTGVVKIKQTENYGLERIRYGLNFKAGSPGFYVWSTYYLNPMWKANRGPFNNEANQVSFGIALGLF